MEQVERVSNEIINKEKNTPSSDILVKEEGPYRVVWMKGLFGGLFKNMNKLL